MFSNGFFQSFLQNRPFEFNHLIFMYFYLNESILLSSLFVSFMGFCMKQEWYLAKDLIHVPGLPSTPQGINKRAKVEGWVKRPVSVPGVRGRSFEYHIDSLPQVIRHYLGSAQEAGVSQPSANYKRDDSVGLDANTQEWLKIYELMTEEERNSTLQVVRRKGIDTLLAITDEENQGLISLPPQAKKTALLLAKLPVERVKEIFDIAEMGEHGAVLNINKK
ncbi:DNA-binding protein [Yersinia kristensenii]|nr:DNA-binding protein [Yersinia kristensenii]MDR4896048.1 DNA-binding protein [Yersinia kristensenii]